MLVLFLIFVITLIAVWRLKNYCRGANFMGKFEDLSRKVAIVTGGGSGIGLELVKDLAQRGCRTIIADISDSTYLAKEINQGLKQALVDYQYLDLGDLQSIRQFVERIKEEKIDILVNNAGVMGLPTLCLTKQNLEYHFGVNYVGHFYLTHLLWNKLFNSQFFRLIIVSSITHRKILGFGAQTILQFTNFNFEDGRYNKDVAYARSKLCLTMFARSLSSIIPSEKGLVVSIHPGIVRSNITKNMFTGGFQIVFKIISPLYWIVTKSCRQGIQTILYALHSDKHIMKSGSFYSDCTESWTNPQVEKHQKKLFQVTQKILSIEFGK